jgi:hypothetical protein
MRRKPGHGTETLMNGYRKERTGADNCMMREFIACAHQQIVLASDHGR